MPDHDTNIVDAVNSRYSTIARNQKDENQAISDKVAATFGYTPQELAALPKGTNLGLSCGNPIGMVNVKEGECVVDLGSGGGIDVILAAKKVGSSGHVIGLDMSEDMLALARRNVEKAGFGPPQVIFQHATLPNLPLPSESADLVVSNCVLNLLPENSKREVWKEIQRILKPGGRVAISDILARKEMPTAIKNNISQWVGCVAGASLQAEYNTFIEDSGLRDIAFLESGADLSIYATVPGLADSGSCSQSTSCCAAPKTSCCDTSTPTIAPDFDVNEYVGSYLIMAVKCE